MDIKNKIKYFIKGFDYLRVYNSPFKPPQLKWYCGKIAIGTPYFYPRIWKRNKSNPGYSKAFPRKIGFDFVSLGWKIKWRSDDYRFEWNPLISFVFFKWQIALMFIPENDHQYWEAWLYYTKQTDKKLSVKERIALCRKNAPQKWSRIMPNNVKVTTDYYNLILKKEWL